MADKQFFDSVYDVVREIPEGKVTTYGIIADLLGEKKSARMVGWALNACHGLGDVPAHRVVNRNGLLTGRMHFNPPEKMQQLLEEEGLTIIENQIQDFEKYVWNPKDLY